MPCDAPVTMITFCAVLMLCSKVRAGAVKGGARPGIPVFHWLLKSKFYGLCCVDEALAGLVLGQFRHISGHPLPISRIFCIWIVEPLRHDPGGEMVLQKTAHTIAFPFYFAEKPHSYGLSILFFISSAYGKSRLSRPAAARC